MKRKKMIMTIWKTKTKCTWAVMRILLQPSYTILRQRLVSSYSITENIKSIRDNTSQRRSKLNLICLITWKSM